MLAIVSSFEKASAPLRATVLACLLAAAVALAAWPGLTAQFVYGPRLEAIIADLHSDPLVLDSVREQNRRLAHAPEAHTSAMDDAWVAEKNRGGGPTIDAMLASPLSRHLRGIVGASGGVVRHVIVMDAGGRNVAAPFATSDYFQGDEPKWLATFARAAGSRHVAPRELGHDGSFVACWISEPLNDPRTGSPLGAMSIEVDANLVPDSCAGTRANAAKPLAAGSRNPCGRPVS
jgi:hypothetical protein